MKASVVMCPPHTLLESLSGSYRGKRISFGAQDMHHEDGAHTGEVSPHLVKDAGCRYVIVGHAERRKKGEDDEYVSKKVGAALDSRLTPIVAVGEIERDRDGRYLDELSSMVLQSLSLVSEKTLKKIIIAYEPVWAIGAPLAPDARTIRETIIFIRKTLATKFPKADALKVPILYGGAVNSSTAGELLEHAGINGFLLGRASVDATEFTDIVREFGH